MLLQICCRVFVQLCFRVHLSKFSNCCLRPCAMPRHNLSSINRRWCGANCRTTFASTKSTTTPSKELPAGRKIRWRFTAKTPENGRTTQPSWRMPRRMTTCGMLRRYSYTRARTLVCGGFLRMTKAIKGKSQI